MERTTGSSLFAVPTPMDGVEAVGRGNGGHDPKVTVQPSRYYVPSPIGMEAKQANAQNRTFLIVRGSPLVAFVAQQYGIAGGTLPLGQMPINTFVDPYLHRLMMTVITEQPFVFRNDEDKRMCQQRLAPMIELYLRLSMHALVARLCEADLHRAHPLAEVFVSPANRGGDSVRQVARYAERFSHNHWGRGYALDALSCVCRLAERKKDGLAIFGASVREYCRLYGRDKALVLVNGIAAALNVAAEIAPHDRPSIDGARQRLYNAAVMHELWPHS